MYVCVCVCVSTYIKRTCIYVCVCVRARIYYIITYVCPRTYVPLITYIICSYGTYVPLTD